jgi:hypothetical protein
MKISPDEFTFNLAESMQCDINRAPLSYMTTQLNGYHEDIGYTSATLARTRTFALKHTFFEKYEPKIISDAMLDNSDLMHEFCSVLFREDAAIDVFNNDAQQDVAFFSEVTTHPWLQKQGLGHKIMVKTLDALRKSFNQPIVLGRIAPLMSPDVPPTMDEDDIFEGLSDDIRFTSIDRGSRTYATQYERLKKWYASYGFKMWNANGDTPFIYLDMSDADTQQRIDAMMEEISE